MITCVLISVYSCVAAPLGAGALTLDPFDLWIEIIWRQLNDDAALSLLKHSISRTTPSPPRVAPALFNGPIADTNKIEIASYVRDNSAAEHYTTKTPIPPQPRGH